MKILVRWLLLAAALLLVAYLYPGVTVTSFGSAMIAAFVLGLFNTLLRPLLVLLTLPVTLLTLGLFLFVINALMFWAAAQVLDGFNVNGFVRGADRLADLQPVRHGDRRGDGAAVLSALSRLIDAGAAAALTTAPRTSKRTVCSARPPGPSSVSSCRPGQGAQASDAPLPDAPAVEQPGAVLALEADALRRRRDVGVEREDAAVARAA